MTTTTNTTSKFNIGAIVTAPFEHGPDYKVAKLFDNDIITIDIPHQHTASANHHYNKADLIERAYICANDEQGFQKFNRPQLEECFGDELPEDALSILAKNPVAYLVNNTWTEPAKADEYEWAVDVLGHDLHAFYVFKELDDAIEFMHSHSRHQHVRVRLAIAEVLKTYGFIEEIENDDE